MSWKTMNTILANALIDETFCQELLDNPVKTIQPRKFELTAEEQEKISNIKARNLTEFSRMVLVAFDKKV